MFAFRLRMLERCQADNISLAIWELNSLFKHRVAISEMPIDLDVALQHFIDEVLPEEDREAFREEPLSAESDMLDAFEADLISMVRQREVWLGAHYPFVVDRFRKLTVKPEAELTAVGSAYLGLQFFRLWHEKLVEIDEEDEVKRRAGRLAFQKWFPRLFEMTAGYAVAGDKIGVPHMTSHCRSSQRLNRMLGSLCVRLSAGQVRTYADWNVEQLASNDGGIDAVVHAGGPGMPGHAQLILVGATIQSEAIDKKIIGPEARDRFKSYFSAQPAAFTGALVRPFDSDFLTLSKCRQKDCLLYSFDDLVQFMGVRNGGQHSRRYYAFIDGSVRRQAREVSGAVLVEDFDRYELSLP